MPHIDPRIFPTILICLDFCASIPYLLQDLKPVVVITRTTNMIKTSGIKGTKVIKNIGKNLKTK